MRKHPKSLTGTIEAKASAQGFYSYRVMNSDGSPACDWIQQKNLLLPAGLAASPSFWASLLGACHAGTGATANSAALDGTFSQTGSTVTRTGGAGTFVSGNVGDFIKFASGERARIVTFTNSVTVQVDRSQEVASAAITVYDCSRLYLDTWVKATTTTDATAGFNGNSYTTETGTFRVWKTFNQSAETVSRTYTEIGISPSTGGTSTTTLLSRLLLESPVNVLPDQFLQVRFDLVVNTGNYRTSAAIPLTITGWPYPYQIQSITSNGTYWDVVVGAACSSHYAVGRPIIISGALPASTVISSISSTSTEFTVNSTGHGKSIGDTVVIASSSQAGYNGTWVVATVPNANSFTVTSAINLGAATGGTVRLATPATWYNGTHTIASFPNSTTIRITNSNSIAAAGLAGTVTNSVAAQAIIVGQSCTAGQPSILDFATGGTAIQNKATVAVIAEANLMTGLVHGTSPSAPTNVGTAAGTTGAYDANLLEQEMVMTLATSAANNQTIRQLAIGNFSQPTGKLIITFDERQRKDNGYILTLKYKIKWEPDLN